MRRLLWVMKFELLVLWCNLRVSKRKLSVFRKSLRIIRRFIKLLSNCLWLCKRCLSVNVLNLSLNLMYLRRLNLCVRIWRVMSRIRFLKCDWLSKYVKSTLRDVWCKNLSNCSDSLMNGNCV